MRMTLAQGNPSIVVWSLVLMAMVVAGFLLASWVRNRVRQTDEPASSGFSLGELRELHRKGQLTDAEFERAKQKLVGMLRKDPPARP